MRARMVWEYCEPRQNERKRRIGQMGVPCIGKNRAWFVAYQTKSLKKFDAGRLRSLYTFMVNAKTLQATLLRESFHSIKLRIRKDDKVVASYIVSDASVASEVSMLTLKKFVGLLQTYLKN